MSDEAAQQCLVLFANSDIPVVLPVPRNVDEFPRAGSKRNRQNEESVNSLQYIGSNEVQGREEFKGEVPAEILQQPVIAVPNLRPSQWESQVRDALERYSVFSEGARTHGPDFTPADWGAELPLQDIPWSQLAWVCSLGHPLDFIPTSHIQRVRLAFIHCLQAVFDSPNKITCGREFVSSQRYCLSTSVNVEELTLTRRLNSSWATVGHLKWVIFRGGWRRRCKPRTVVANSQVRRLPRIS